MFDFDDETHLQPVILSRFTGHAVDADGDRFLAIAMPGAAAPAMRRRRRERTSSFCRLCGTLAAIEHRGTRLLIGLVVLLGAAAALWARSCGT
jgi:hypothetical protein